MFGMLEGHLTKIYLPMVRFAIHQPTIGRSLGSSSRITAVYIQIMCLAILKTIQWVIPSFILLPATFPTIHNHIRFLHTPATCPITQMTLDKQIIGLKVTNAETPVMRTIGKPWYPRICSSASKNQEWST